MPSVLPTKSSQSNWGQSNWGHTCRNDWGVVVGGTATGTSRTKTNEAQQEAEGDSFHVSFGTDSSKDQSGAFLIKLSE